MRLYYILTVAKEAIIPHRSVSLEAQRVDKKCQEAQIQSGKFVNIYDLQ